MNFITTKEQIDEYVTLGFDFSFQTIKPYIRKVERKHIVPVVGSDLYKQWGSSEPSEAAELEVFDLLKEASASLALASYTPQGSVHISDAGISTTSGESYKTAEWWQVKDLRRELVDQGFSAIDEAYVILEGNANEAAFALWKNSKNYTIFNELITAKTSDFQRYFDINNSRRTFLALRPYLLEVQEQYFNVWLKEETLNTIKNASGFIPKKAKQLSQAAQVSFAVAKAAESGVFLFGSNGMYLQNVVMPWDKTKFFSIQELERLKNSRQCAAEEYMKLLNKLILDNATEFPDFNIPEEKEMIAVFNTNSIVSF